MLSKILITFLVCIFSSSLLGMRTKPQAPRHNNFKKDINLIIGYDRAISSINDPLADSHHKHNKLYLSHLNSFNINAPIIEYDDYIVADARLFDFSNYVILSVLIERLPTIVEDRFTDNHIRFINDQINYIGGIINNISPYMPVGASMEMEWLPYTALYGFSPEDLDLAISKNPFHCFINYHVLLDAIFMLNNDKENINIGDKNLYYRTIKMAEQIDSMLNFYHQHGTGAFNDLLQIIYLEARVIHQMIHNQQHIFLDYNIIDQNHEALAEALKNSFFGIFPHHLLGKRSTIATAPNTEIKGHIYDISSFIDKSFISVLIQDIAAQYNAPKLYNYLKTLKFKDISIKKRQNPYSKWIIKMTKSR